MTQRPRLVEIAADGRFQALLARRRRLRIGLSGATLALFFGFVLLTSTPLGAAIAHDRIGAMPAEMLIAVVIIAFVIAATGFYVAWSNSRIDPAIDALRREFGL